MGWLLWLLSPAAVMSAVGLVGILAVLLIAWGLAAREPWEYQEMDRAHRAWGALRRAASTPQPPRRSRGA